MGAASERAVRTSGAVPATISVVDGEVRVGLDAATISTLRPRPGKRGPQAQVRRRSRRRCLRAGRGASGRRPSAHARCLPAERGCRVIAGTRRGLGRVHQRLGHEARTCRPISASSTRAPVIVVLAPGQEGLLMCRRRASLLETLGIPVLGFRTTTPACSMPARGGRPVWARVDDVRVEACRDVSRPTRGLGRTTAWCRPPARREPRRRRGP